MPGKWVRLFAETGKNFYDSIFDNPHFGYRIIGFLDDKRKTFLNGKYLGKIDELDNVLSNERVDDVIIALPNYATDKLEEVVRTCENHTTRIKIIPDYFKFIHCKNNVSMFNIAFTYLQLNKMVFIFF